MPAAGRGQQDEPARAPLVDFGEGVRGLEIAVGTKGQPVREGDEVRVRLRGRLATKNGWLFLDDFADDDERLLVFNRGWVRGLEVAVVGMRPGGVRRVILPPPVSYTDPEQEPVPTSYWGRQRLRTTVFNDVRLANGEGDTLATTIFDVEVVGVRSRAGD